MGKMPMPRSVIAKDLVKARSYLVGKTSIRVETLYRCSGDGAVFVKNDYSRQLAHSKLFHDSPIRVAEHCHRNTILGGKCTYLLVGGMVLRFGRIRISADPINQHALRPIVVSELFYSL